MAKNVNDKKIKQEPPKKLDDGLTKAGRRSRNLALKTAAMEKALAANLPWDEEIKPARFFEDPDAAYLEATTSVNAIPAATIIAKQKEIADSIAAAAEERKLKAAADAAEKAASTQTLAEAAKAALIGNTANDNTEVATAEMEMKPDEPATTASADEPAEQESADNTEVQSPAADENLPVVEEAPEQKDEVLDDSKPTDTPVAEDQQSVSTDVNPRDRRPGEKTKAYNQRIHKLDQEERRLKKAAKAAEAVAAATETRNGEPVVEGDAGNAQADLPVQTEKRYPTGVMYSHSDYDGKSVQLTVTATQADDETKVSDELVEHGSFAAVAAAEKAEESKPVEIPAEETPAETPAPVQTEPEATPESGPVEAKTTKKPTLSVASSQPEKPEVIAAAKKFYGSAWTDERAALLTKAYKWLTVAVKLSQEPNITSTRVNLPMNAALRHEAEAFGTKPVIYNHAVDGGVTMAMAA